MARFPYLYPAGTGWPSYTPGHWVPLFVASYDSQDSGGGIFFKNILLSAMLTFSVQLRKTWLTLLRNVNMTTERNFYVRKPALFIWGNLVFLGDTPVAQ
jgi:hypothetical protein